MAETKTDKERATEEAARQIIDVSRKKLAMDLPELLPCIYLLPAKAHETEIPLCTDGEHLLFCPKQVVADYLERKNAVCEQMLHVLTHGLLGHFSKREGQPEALFDAAADIKATDFIARLKGGYVHPRDWPRETRSLLRSQAGVSLEQLSQVSETSQEAVNLITRAQPMRSDPHDLWGKASRNKGQGPGGAGKLNSIWQAATQSVAQNLMAKGQGDLVGMMSEIYREAEDSGVSYADFLRRFLSIRERREIDPDSIDRIWYHAGLELLGDVPIVEPDELREDAPDLRLAVALDTSGSCQGEVMVEFLGELLAILRDSGGPKVELTLIQCDDQIQKVSVLTREDNAEEIAESFTTFGGCGTDFCPVFEYLEEAREDPERADFKGLLYLSDGWGDFPDKAPDYPVAFLFPRDEDDFTPIIPDWVIRVRITEDNRLDIQEEN